MLRGSTSPKTNHGFPLYAGRTDPMLIADWLEEMAVYGIACNPLDSEIAYQLSLAIENWYLVTVALKKTS
jgi:hypothetical protein